MQHQDFQLQVAHSLMDCLLSIDFGKKRSPDGARVDADDVVSTGGVRHQSAPNPSKGASIPCIAGGLAYMESTIMLEVILSQEYVGIPIEMTMAEEKTVSDRDGMRI